VGRSIFNPRFFISTHRFAGQLRDFPSLRLHLVRNSSLEPLYSSLLGRYHYLGYRQIVGSHLKYMAFIGERPVACLGWGSAAWRVRCREEFIGWDHATKVKNLSMVANNTRFLILPGWYMMVSPFERFTVGHVSKKLNQINLEVSLAHPKPFPKRHLLSNYRFNKRFVEILPDGSIRGGYPKMITSLVDFSFIRSLVAHRYAQIGPPCYDPPSIFLIDLFRYLDRGYFNGNDLLSLLRDEDRGRAYRTYAGFHLQNLPCEATLSNTSAINATPSP
jgi:hypothetical protein